MPAYTFSRVVETKNVDDAYLTPPFVSRTLVLHCPDVSLTFGFDVRPKSDANERKYGYCGRQVKRR